MTKANRSIAPDSFPVTSPKIDDTERQGTLPTGPRLVSTSPDSRASNEARAWLAVADVTPTGHRVGIIMARHVRYATVADLARKVTEGEVFTYWPQSKIAVALGCSQRQVRRGVNSLKAAGLKVRQRDRPGVASYVFPVRSGVLSGVRSGVRSLKRNEPRSEPRTEPRTEAAAASTHDRTEVQPDEQPDKPTRNTCPKCGKTWPARYGPTCYQCPQPTASQIRRREQLKRNRESEQDPPLDDAPARPDPPPITPETRAQLEAEAIENGFHKLDDGSWTKRNAPSPQPSPPVEPTTTTPDEARKHINDMLDTARNARAPLPRRRPDGQPTA